MKILNKIFILSLSLLFVGIYGCKDITELNKNPKQATKVPSESLFANAVKNLSDAMASTSVNLNNFRLIVQHWTETDYPDEAQYNFDQRNSQGAFWTALYRDVIADLRETKRLVQEEKYDFEEERNNRLAIADLIEVYAFSVLVNTFGDIPYSQAIDFNNLQPQYDDAETIMRDLIQRIDNDIALLNDAYGSYGSYDLIYGGDVTKWITFAHSLKLRLAMIMADADPAYAAQKVAEAAPNVFTSQDERAAFRYLSAPPNTNPVWVSLVQSGRLDFIAANTFIDELKTLNDPRIDDYFNPRALDGTFEGGIYGEINPAANIDQYSLPGDKVQAPDAEHVLLDYVETEFLKAEAVERGFITGNAKTHYNNAIEASIKYWGGTDSEVASYLSQSSVDYDTAPGTYKEKIGKQAWIALYNRGWIAWTVWRRLDAPALTAPPKAIVNEVPKRLTYPIDEQNLNEQNWQAAANKIGGDELTTKLFWDKN